MLEKKEKMKVKIKVWRANCPYCGREFESFYYRAVCNEIERHMLNAHDIPKKYDVVQLETYIDGYE